MKNGPGLLARLVLLLENRIFVGSNGGKLLVDVFKKDETGTTRKVAEVMPFLSWIALCGAVNLLSLEKVR